VKIKTPNKNIAGFTLIETIIYIGLFGIIFSGIFSSMYPIFTNASRLTSHVAAEGETAFIIAKINYALKASITDSQSSITSPAENTNGHSLILSHHGDVKFIFAENETNDYCIAPLTCHTLTLKENESGQALPLNTQRVTIENFTVTHVAPSGGMPRYLDITFTANGIPMGPIRYYLHF
jgi:type II secretory pathway pseudopilin PulG